VRILPGFLVCGHLGPHSHAWLELGEFQIDITADQFVRDPEKELWSGRPGDLREGVIVTSDRSWHWKFEEQIRHSADLSLYDASSRQSSNTATARSRAIYKSHENG
jgi:hypothetical protein